MRGLDIVTKKTLNWDACLETGSNPDPYLIVKKNNLGNGLNPDPKPQWRGERENGLNPDPNSKYDSIIRISVRIRIQTKVKNNLEYGSNPDPKIRTDRLKLNRVENGL